MYTHRVCAKSGSSVMPSSPSSASRETPAAFVYFVFTGSVVMSFTRLVCGSYTLRVPLRSMM
jgi:hypothetical protein